MTPKMTNDDQTYVGLAAQSGAMPGQSHFALAVAVQSEAHWQLPRHVRCMHLHTVLFSKLN
eukprot:552148-Amphidinium_carterae.1